MTETQVRSSGPDIGEFSGFIAAQRLMRQIRSGEGDLIGIPTGFKDLDERLAGLRPGDLIILAARPAMGKTALALNLVLTQLASRKPVVYVSFESSKERLLARVLCSKAGVDLYQLDKGSLSPGELRRVEGEVTKLEGVPLYILDKAAPTLAEIEDFVEKIAHQHSQVGLVVIDWLQHMTWCDYPHQTQEKYREALLGIKFIAQRFYVPVVALSQLNRAPESRGAAHPQFQDLPSVEIRKHADSIWLLHVEEYYDADSPKKGTADLLIIQNRHGPIGSVRLAKRVGILGFSDLSEKVGPLTG